MPLREVELPVVDFELPDHICAYLLEADQRVSEFIRNPYVQVGGFVPCCFETVCRTLMAIEELSLAPGNLFCEWGSGFGVVASVAGMLGFDACGIEIDRDLHDAATELAEDFDIPVEFINGSFIPAGADDLIERASVDGDDKFMLNTFTDGSYDDLGLDVCDFDLVFAYPWPHDEELTDILFERYAAHGALLLTYSGLESVRIKRKIASGQ